MTDIKADSTSSGFIPDIKKGDLYHLISVV